MKPTSRPLTPHRRPLLLAAAAFGLASFATLGTSQGALQVWDNGLTSGFWGVAANWSTAIPTSIDDADFRYVNTLINVDMTGSRNALNLVGRGNSTVNFNFGSNTALTVASAIQAGQQVSGVDRWAVLNFNGPSSGTSALTAASLATGNTIGSGIKVSGTNMTANISTFVDVGRTTSIAGLGGGSTTKTSGGTYFEVANAAKVNVTGTITTYTALTSEGVNRVSVLNGSLTAAAIALGDGNAANSYSRGRLQMGTSGTITATTISLRERSYFEAEGSGLNATVNMSARFDPGHEGGGTLLVGVRSGSPRSVPSTLTLGNSTINMTDTTNIAMSLFSGTTSDQINFLSSGTMSLAGTVNFIFSNENSHVFALNDTWTLFTGSTANIIGSGTFALSLPTLSGGLAWDQSDFNQAGAWKLTVVPEPATVLMLGLGAAFLLVRSRRTSRTS